MAEYIDRKALGIGKCNPDVFENKGYAEGWNSAIEIIENAPAADVVEVKHGKWIERENNYDTYYDCSVCSESFVFIDGDPIDNLYQYCPNCGAKMDGEHNEK